MDQADNWRMRALLELEQGEAARAVGNDGRSRVCARRAAGIIASEYLRQLGEPVNTPSAYELLRILLSSPHTSPEVREKTSHFLMRVETDFTLPIDVDLLAEARWLAQELLDQAL